MRLLTVDKLTFSHKHHLLFSNASLSIDSGDIIGLLGPNGSGKTSFFDMICGLTNRNSPAITKRFKSHLYLSQTVTTPHTLRMFDISNIITLLCSKESKIEKKTLSKLAKWCPEIIARYDSIWKKKSATCSYGEKRWFFTLALLTINAEIIILDEPTAGVDPEFRYYIWKCLKSAAAEGTAILVSSHNIQEISDNCDRFYMINNHTFNHFSNGEDFINHYGAQNLDEAFIHAASGSSLQTSLYQKP